MWSYVKRLEYPVNIKNPNPAAAKVILDALGGKPLPEPALYDAVQ